MSDDRPLQPVPIEPPKEGDVLPPFEEGMNPVVFYKPESPKVAQYKAAKVNIRTQIVESILLLDSLDYTEKGYKIVEIPIVIQETPVPEGSNTGVTFISSNNTVSTISFEYPVEVGITKWNKTVGFYE